MAGTTRLELATSAVTGVVVVTSCDFTAPIGTLGALRNPQEVLLHPNCTQIFARPVNASAFLATNPTGDSYLPSWPITSSKWSKKYQSILLDARPEWQDTRSLSQTECQFGKLSFFKSAANRGSLCKLFSSGSIFVDIRLGYSCA